LQKGIVGDSVGDEVVGELEVGPDVGKYDGTSEGEVDGDNVVGAGVAHPETLHVAGQSWRTD
jgi:hypothetical protein